MVKRLSWIFGIAAGLFAAVAFAGANLSGTPLFDRARALWPGFFQAHWSALIILAIFAVPFMAGVAAAERIQQFSSVLKVGALTGLICGSILFVTGMSVTVLFHDAMMKDPSNIHEYRSHGAPMPTEAQLSSFLYWDALAGLLNMMWISTLTATLLAGIGGVADLLLHPKPGDSQPA